MHELRERAGACDQDQREDHGSGAEQADSAADRPPGLIRPVFPDFFADEDSDAHREAGDDHGRGLQEHTSGRHAGHVGGAGELADDEQIHAAVEGL